MQILEADQHGVEIHLSEQVSRQLLEMVEDIEYIQTKHSQDEASVKSLIERVDLLPDQILAQASKLLQKDCNFLMINNLPTQKQNEILLAIASTLGAPFAHIDEAALISCVKPQPLEPHQSTETSYYTWNKFDLHTELPYTRYPPDFIALWCIRNQGAINYLCSVETALERLTFDDLVILRKKIFRFHVPPHFGYRHTFSKTLPIIEVWKGKTALRLKSENLKCKIREGRAAALRLAEALKDGQISYCMRPNSLLIFNNRLMAHGRSSFIPTFDQRDRELRRVYICQNISSLGKSYDPCLRRISGL